MVSFFLEVLEVLIAINDLPDFCFAWPTGTTPVFLFYIKSGYVGGLGPGVLGGGTLTPINVGGGGQDLYKYKLASGETDTKGDLSIYVSDNIATDILVATHQVVTALPGDPGELTNPERDAVAAALLGYSNGVDIGVSPAHALAAMCAILAGKESTVGFTSRFRNWADTKDRVTITGAPGGNRVTVVFDFS